MALSKEKFTDLALERFRKADDFWHNWRTGAVDDYAFVGGQQWLQEDEEHLKSEKRPPVTFNYSEKMVDAVVGAEVSNRQEANYRPRGVEDSALVEIWNNAAKWARDECDAEDEESDAFRDMLVCGMGWTQTRMDYSEDLDGKIIIERIDPLEMWCDPAASKRGLTDRRYQYRRWWIDEKTANREWPNQMLNNTTSEDASGGVVRRGRSYNEYDGQESPETRHPGQVEVIHYECFEDEPVYRVAVGEEIKEVSVKDFNAMRDQLDEAKIPYVKQYKRVYYRGFFNDETLLEMTLSPCQQGFTFTPITGKRDRNRNTFYGITRVMKDPQRWANKWLSQIMHIINTNAKGGIMAEIGAFVDPTRAQEEWAKPDSITLMNEGAISGGKVQQKQQAPYPAGLDKLMEFALGSLPMVTGINLEALGLANREQAGVLEAQRKQAAYGLLAPLFDALRRYRKVQGRILLHFIHTFISDGRLIRIGGPENEQFVPLTKAKDAPRYDVIVDQSPNSPDSKAKTWEALMQLVPSLLKAGLPLPPSLLEYSPLPTGLVTKWKESIAQQGQPDPQMQEQVQAMQAEIEKLGQENMQLKQDKSLEIEAFKQKAQIAQAELKLKQEAQVFELQLEQQKQAAQLQFEQQKLSQDAAIKQKQLKQDVGFKQAQLESDNALNGLPSSTSSISSTEIADGIRKIAESNDTIAQSTEQNNAAMMQAMQQLAAALQQPRKLINDQSGRPVGVGPAQPEQEQVPQ